MKKIIIILVLIFSYNTYSQMVVDTIYHVELTASIFPVFNYFRHERLPGIQGNFALGYGAGLRCLWHPGRLLAVGIMSGYTFLSEDEVPDKSGDIGELVAIPLQIIVSMQGNRFEFGMGMGPYLLISTISSGTIARGYRLELALTLYSTYNIEITKNLYVGPEVKLSYLSFRGIFSLMPSLSVRYNFINY